MNDSLADLFPDGEYRFHLTLRRSEPRDFFLPRDPSGAVRAERARWLTTEPARYAALLPEGEPLLSELSELAVSWGILTSTRSAADPLASIREVGAALEPDILLLSTDAEGRFRLRGGALCFPTGWALHEKLGHPLDFIHGIVPGLNPALGSPIQQFLSKLKPGVAFLRDNWGIAATNERNLHPAREIGAPKAPVLLDRLWLRVEHQALVALPRTGGILFAIRIALHRLDELAGKPSGGRLRDALGTMPAELAAYKRIERIRDELIPLL